MKLHRTILAICISLSWFLAISQDVYNIGEGSEIVVHGTSTLHDWEMSVQSISGSGTFEISNNKIQAIKSLNLEFESSLLKSGKDGMDKNAYKSLKSEEYPLISYSLEQVNGVQNKDGVFMVDATGNVTVITNSLQVNDLVACVISDADVVCKGEVELQMTSFAIDPPTALVGSIKSGDDITVSYELTFVR